MSAEGSDGSALYAKRQRTLSELVSWGIFLLLAMMPIAVILSFEVSYLCLAVYLSIPFVCAGIFFILLSWANQAGRGMWINPLESNPYDQARRVLLSAYSGAVAFAVLSSLSVYWRLSYRYGASISEILDYVFDYLIIGFIFAAVLPISYIFTVLHEKRQKEERIRGKSFPVRKEDLERAVIRTLDTLGLSYEEVDEGSRWFGPLPSYKIKEHEISLRIFEIKAHSSKVVTVARASVDYDKAEEIERRIDTLVDPET